jgi:hypothetical protein
MLRPFVGGGKVNLGDQACAVNAIYALTMEAQIDSLCAR